MKYVVQNIKKLTNIFSEIRSEIEKGNTINLSYEKAHRPKTYAQLGYFFGGLVDAISKHFEEHYGTEYDAEIIKEMLYNECGQTEELICPNGKVLYQHKRISRMEVQEMSDFIEKVIDFCDEYGIVLQPELKYLWINNLNPRLVEEVENTKYPDKDPEYLSYVAKETCLICGKGGVEVHHAKTLELAGLGAKTPDYMGVPLCAKCHRYCDGEGHISSERILQLCKNFIGNLTIKQFCKLRYHRWLKHK